jgi:uncharacterized membrane protein
MVWNLFLAAVPAALAIALFRRRARRSLTWWAGLGVWLLFLPNAPYVLTDVMHLVDDIRATSSDAHAYLSIITYGVFFTAGLASYVFSLQLFRRYLHTVWPARAVLPTLLLVHGLCVVAMYIGRVMRFNSWDAILAPGDIAASVIRVPRPTTVVVLMTTFVVVGIGTYAMAAVASSAHARLRRWVR